MAMRGNVQGFHPKGHPNGAQINQNKLFQTRISESYPVTWYMENENLLEPPAKPDSLQRTSH